MSFYYEIKKNKCIEIDGNRINLEELGYYDLDNYCEFFEFSNKLICVKNNSNKFGIINMNGKEIVPCIYQSIRCESIGCNESVFIVKDLSNQFGIINTNGKEIVPCTYLSIYYVGEGKFCAHQKRREKLIDQERNLFFYQGGKEILIDQEGKVLSGEYDHLDSNNSFKNGYLIVENNNKKNFLNKEGSLLFNEWLEYDDVYPFDDEGHAKVEKDGKVNYIDKKGVLLLETWIDYDLIVDRCYDEYLQVFRYNNKEWNLIDKKGNLLFEKWAKYKTCANLEDFNDGCAKVWDKDENGYTIVNYINKKGHLLLNDWLVYDGPDYFCLVSSFSDGVARIEIMDTRGSRINFIDTEGKFLFENGLKYPFVDHFHDGKACVYYFEGERRRYNYIDKKGNLLYSEWFESENEPISTKKMYDIDKVVKINRNQMKSVVINDKEYPIILLETKVKISLDSDSKEYVFTDEQQEEKALMVVDYFLDTIENKNEFFAKKLVK